MKKLLVAAASIASLSGCALSLNMPTVRFESPEAQGTLGHGYVALGAAGGNDLTIIPDTTASNPTEQTSFSGSGNIPVMVGLGILDRLDIEGRLQGALNGTSVPLLTAKYELIGAPRSRAKTGNFALAATLGGGAASETQNDGNLGSTSAATDVHFWEFDSSLIAGYRIADNVMIYGGPFYSHYGFHGTDTQSGGGAAAPLIFAGTANQSGINVGQAMDMGPVEIKAELAYAYATSEGANNSGVSVGALITFFGKLVKLPAHEFDRLTGLHLQMRDVLHVQELEKAIRTLS